MIFEYGLNAYVNANTYCWYKRIEPNVRLLNIGFSFREPFFSSLPIKLEDDFFERAAMVLNPELLSIPKITAICNGMKDCTPEGNALSLYIHGKSLEVFSLLYDDELSIVEIAKSVGYYGDGYFQKAFKDTYGVTPNQMRKDCEKVE